METAEVIRLINPAGNETEVNSDFDIQGLLAKGFKLAPSQIQKMPVEEVEDGYSKYFNSFTVSMDGFNDDGYGRATSNLFDVLKRVGIHPNNNKAHRLFFLFHTPHAIQSQLDKTYVNGESPDYRIGLTMWETSRLPDGWADACNELDELIVPSKYCKKVFQESGVTIPINVLPLPINVEKYPFRRRRIDSDPFHFLQYAQLTRRKGWHLTVQAFQEEFGPSEPVKLTVKSRIGIKWEDELDPRIKLFAGTWEHNKMLDLIYSADCFVNPSMGEGYGMCDMEVMSTGLCTISTYEHSLKDHLNLKACYPLRNSKLIDVTYDDMQSWLHNFKTNKTMGKWHKPSVKEIRELMRYAFENREETINRGILGAEHIRNKFSYDALQSKIREFFNARV